MKRSIAPQGGHQLCYGDFTLASDNKINLRELTQNLFAGITGVNPSIDRLDLRYRPLDLLAKVQRIGIGHHGTGMTYQGDLGANMLEALNYLGNLEVPCVSVDESNLM